VLDKLLFKSNLLQLQVILHEKCNLLQLLVTFFSKAERQSARMSEIKNGSYF